MSDFSRDPLISIVHRGTKEPIRLLLANHFLDAALKLVFSGIDTMAFLGLPAQSTEVTASDFIAWCDRYLQLPGRDKVSSLELYAARCGLLHCHSGESRLHRQGQVRVLHWTDQGTPVLYRPEIDPDLVIVSIQALVDCFFDAIDRFLVELFRDPGRAEVANLRLQNMFVCSTVEDLHGAT